jgi:xanthine dehydrogenase accessory factor
LIRAALDAGVGYIGLVASKVRGAAVLAGLELSDAEWARVHTPVGLPIGAKTPAEIAVSIVAEVIEGIRVGGLTAPTRDTRRRPATTDAVDPVCGMTVRVGAASEHLLLDGQDYWFCCAVCRTSFAATKADV